MEFALVRDARDDRHAKSSPNPHLAYSLAKFTRFAVIVRRLISQSAFLCKKGQLLAPSLLTLTCIFAVIKSGKGILGYENFNDYFCGTLRKISNMSPAQPEKPSLLGLIKALPADGGWGPPVSSETMLGGVPYAPYSKSDKLGRMADWTEGKDRDRGGRQQYGGRNFRGTALCASSSGMPMVVS